MYMREDVIKALSDLGDYKNYPWKFYAEDFVKVLEETCLVAGCDMDFYIETLTSSAWQWDTFYELSYYNPTLDAIMLFDEIRYEYKFETKDDLVDFIMSLQDSYQQHCDNISKFLIHKDWENVN